MKAFFICTSWCTLLLFTSCKSHKEHHHKPSSFTVTSPLKKDTFTTNDYVCQIKSIQHIELRALEKGYIQKIFVDEGQFVKKGQLMFQIMPMLYQAEMQKAKAEVDFSEIEYRTTKTLTDSHIVSPNELALAKAKLDKAKAELSLAKTHLGFTQIRAPFSGIMDRFMVRVGSLVDEGELLTSLSDNSQMWVYFNVPEVEYLNYRSTINKDSLTPVQLQLPNHQLFSATGVIEAIEADFNNETGNIAFRATFPNPKGLLRHGETGRILVKVPLEKTLLIPQKATFEILDKRYVFVVDQNSVLQVRHITVGEEMPHLFTVTQGLTENDRILLDGLRKVRAGDQIVQKYQQPATALSQLTLYAE